MSAADDEKQLIADIAEFQHDPLGYVLYVFPWGKPGTELANKTGPRKWQRDFLERVGERLRAGAVGVMEVIQEAVASGNGPGKSTLVAWLIKWALDTLEDTRGIVTANTGPQLKTKTIPEIKKWHRLSLTEHWFQLDATAMYSTQEEHKQTWRVDFVTWDEHNYEAFQGLHNEGKRLIVVMDEASAIADVIWEATEGALTDENTEILWFVFGNPTRTSGRFRECFGRYKHRWSQGNPLQIDSRQVEGTNKVLYDQWVQDHGEDSDFVRIHVRGMFPRASAMQLIPTDVVGAAMKREPNWMRGDPLIMTFDVARGGNDNCVIRFRRGWDGRSIPKTIIPGSESRDSMKVAAKVASLIDQHKPDAIFVDATGIGGPVADRLRQLGYNVIDVHFGAESPDPRYANLRTYMYVKLLEALREGLAIENDPSLEQQLTTQEYTHDRFDRMILEPKDHMKSRGLESPDDADALAMQYAYPVAPLSGAGGPSSGPTQSDIKYRPHARN